MTTLKAASTGEPFEFRGRTVQTTPPPCQPGGPKVAMGGSSEPAARRAARIADGFMISEPDVWDYYSDQTITLGRPDPGPYAGGDTSVVALARDADKAGSSWLPTSFTKPTRTARGKRRTVSPPATAP